MRLFAYSFLVFMIHNPILAQKIEEGNSFLIIETPPSGPDNYYEFCQDGSVWVSYGFDGQGHGKWYINNDTIYFDEFILHYKIGVGEYNLAGDHAWYIHYIGQTALKPKEKFKSRATLQNQNWFEVKKINCDSQNKSEKYYNSLSKMFPGNYGFASYKELQGKELKNFDAQTLRIIRNEIFARYGYVFKSAELQRYFDKQTWYKSTYGSYDSLLTEIEKNNIKLLLELEKNRANTSP